MDELERITLIDVVSETVRNELASYSVEVKINDAQASKIADAIGARISGSPAEVKREIEALRLSISSISAQVDLPKRLVEEAVEKALRNLETRITTAITTRVTAGERERRQREKYHRTALTLSWLFSIVTMLLATLLSYSLGEGAYLWLFVGGVAPVVNQLLAEPEYDETKNIVTWIACSAVPFVTTIIAVANVATRLM